MANSRQLLNAGLGPRGDELLVGRLEGMQKAG